MAEMGGLRIPTDENMYSLYKIGTYGFPFHLSHDNMDLYTDHFVNWHKQKEVEISVILEGTAQVQAFDEKITVSKGEAVLIFPDALHTAKRIGEENVTYFTLLFNPILLYGYTGSFFYENYYKCYHDLEHSIYHIAGQSPWVETALEKLWWFYYHEEDAEIERWKKLQELWLLLCENCFVKAGTTRKKNLLQEEEIVHMMSYMQEHYLEKFSLTELAESVHISRGECCRFFQKMIGMSPLEYLQGYRLQQAMEWLRDSDKNITEISEQAGFSTVSYFISFFKKKMGCTPLQYRKKKREDG